MSLTKSNNINNNLIQINGEVLEKVILENDLSRLSSIEKVEYVRNVCQSLGLNPLTQPFKLLKFNGKETLYATKDATEQLRKVNNVSIDSLETKIIDGIYIVTSNASLPNGKRDSSTGVISISGLKGESLSNAMMKAETKSKRRVTLSICGLGMIDESEADSIKDAKKIDIYSPSNDNSIEIENKRLIPDEEELQIYFNDFMSYIESCKKIDDLQKIFINIKKIDFRNDIESFRKLVSAKDEKKNELSKHETSTFDNETGELT